MREISYVLHVHALMTQKSCAVVMRNAIQRNYLKLIKRVYKRASLDKLIVFIVLEWRLLVWRKTLYLDSE